MKTEIAFVLTMIAVIILMGLMVERHIERNPRKSCWQVGDTLHVVTAKGDTVRLDASKLK